MLAVYTGHEALTFPDYLDLDTGRTLHAEPGGTYDIAPASGRTVPDVPAGWFTAVSADFTEATEVQVEAVEAGEDAPAEGDGASDPGEDGGEQGEDDHSAF